MYYKINDDTVWENTNDILIHNYPPSRHTFTYVTRIYREYKKGVLGWQQVESEPIYLHDLPSELAGYVKIIAEAQNILNNKLPRNGILGEIVDPNKLFL